MLSQRLAELEDEGILDRRKLSKGYSYHLTQAGRDLEGIIDGLAVWGQQWARDNIADDMDIAFLAWSMHLRLNTSALPPGRTVVEFEFSGVPKDCSRFWLVNHGEKAEMCLKNPGYETDLLVMADVATFVEAWRGFRDLRGEIRARRIKLDGPRILREAFPDWLLLSSLAPHERRRPGREKKLCARTTKKAFKVHEPTVV